VHFVLRDELDWPSEGEWPARFSRGIAMGIRARPTTKPRTDSRSPGVERKKRISNTKPMRPPVLIYLDLWLCVIQPALKLSHGVSAELEMFGECLSIFSYGSLVVLDELGRDIDRRRGVDPKLI
jgi:hypothetical protein